MMFCMFSNCENDGIPMQIYLKKHAFCWVCLNDVEHMIEIMTIVIDRNALLVHPRHFREAVVSYYNEDYLPLQEEQYRYALKQVRSYHLQRGREQIKQTIIELKEMGIEKPRILYSYAKVFMEWEQNASYM